jgi:hypothetical protein
MLTAPSRNEPAASSRSTAVAVAGAMLVAAGFLGLFWRTERRER